MSRRKSAAAQWRHQWHINQCRRKQMKKAKNSASGGGNQHEIKA